MRELREPTISVQDLTQHYGVRPVLRDINLEIFAGELVAVAGPNGMGKTTLLAALAGVHSPQKGSVSIGGLVRRSTPAGELAIRRQTVFLPDEAFLPPLMTAREFWFSVGKLYGVDDDRLFEHIERLIDLFDLKRIADSRTSSGSAGQRKKVALSSALITDAPILLLDEPFSGGLDPSGILALRKVLQRLVAERQATVVLTAPVPELVEQLATRVVVLRDGTIVADGSVPELRARAGANGSLADALEQMFFPDTADHVAAYFNNGNGR
jgi:ABC-type multidrug transport system ATPase subunit